MTVMTSQPSPADLTLDLTIRTMGRTLDLTLWRCPSPLGELRLLATEDALVALYMQEHRHAPELETLKLRDYREENGTIEAGRAGNAGSIGNPGSAGHRVLALAREQLAAYFAGRLTTFSLPLAPSGTAFQTTVWQALLTIPFGQTRSYGAIARALGRPQSARAVGAANGRNPISIIIPCHRVIGADGTLVGYGGGAERKRWLLQHEGAAAPSSAQLPLTAAEAQS